MRAEQAATGWTFGHFWQTCCFTKITPKAILNNYICGALRKFLLMNYSAVSYTHLDVYKRQALPSPGNGKEVQPVDNNTLSFIYSILASVVAHYICKWFDEWR